MTFMNRLGGGLLLVFFLINNCYSQVSIQQECENKINRFLRLYPQEKAFLITDNVVYIPGEKIWYKLFLWSEGDKSFSVSTSAFVTVRDERSAIVSKQAILVSNNEGYGDINLPDSIGAGLYFIDVFTSWGLNFSTAPLVSKTIWVGDEYFSSYKSPIANFNVEVEGGHFVPGVPNKIVVWRGKNGLDDNSFELIGPDNEIAVKCKLEKEYAILPLTVYKEGVYKAKFCSNEECSEKLIKASNESLLTVEKLGNNYKAVIHGDNHKNQLLFIVSEMRIVVKNDIKDSLVYDCEGLPNGILHFLLFKDARLISSRTIFNKNHKVTIESRKGVITTSSKQGVTFELENDEMEEVPFLAFALPRQLSVQRFYLSELPERDLDDLILFYPKTLIENLEAYLDKGPLKITNSTHASLREVRNIKVPSNSSMRPLDYLLSGLDNISNIDSIILYRRKISRIEKTYYGSLNYEYEKVISDRSYNPKEYFSLKKLGEFLAYSIPNLKFQNGTDRNNYVMRFLFSDLKGKKSNYSGPPVVLVNGFVVSNIKSIEGVNLSDIDSIEILYDPKTITSNGLSTFFPNGAIFIYTSSSRTGPVKSIERGKFFADPFMWPHAFKNSSSFEGVYSERLPNFSNLYFWLPTKKRYKSNTISFNIPEYSLHNPPDLLIFTLDKIRNQKSYRLILK